MTFARVLAGWAVVMVFFVTWRETERRLRGTPGGAGPAIRAALPAIAIEAMLLTLFAGLWFGSLGSGGAVLLFALVGALMEIPSRLRSHPVGELPWKPVVGGVVRVTVAGVILGLVMG